MNCLIGPTPTGDYFTIEITYLEYETMCKQAVDENFCNCETTELKVLDEEARDSVV